MDLGSDATDLLTYKLSLLSIDQNQDYLNYVEAIMVILYLFYQDFLYQNI